MTYQEAIFAQRAARSVGLYLAEINALFLIKKAAEARRGSVVSRAVVVDILNRKYAGDGADFLRRMGDLGLFKKRRCCARWARTYWTTYAVVALSQEVDAKLLEYGRFFKRNRRDWENRNY